MVYLRGGSKLDEGHGGPRDNLPSPRSSRYLRATRVARFRDSWISLNVQPLEWVVPLIFKRHPKSGVTGHSRHDIHKGPSRVPNGDGSSPVVATLTSLDLAHKAEKCRGK